MNTPAAPGAAGEASTTIAGSAARDDRAAAAVGANVAELVGDVALTGTGSRDQLFAHDAARGDAPVSADGRSGGSASGRPDTAANNRSDRAAEDSACGGADRGAANGARIGFRVARGEDEAAEGDESDATHGDLLCAG
jgi:hypothetical protein